MALEGGYLLPQLGNEFVLLCINAAPPQALQVNGIAVRPLALTCDGQTNTALAQRYLGDAPAAVYLLRPDQHVAARWPSYNEPEIRAALLRATAQG